MIAPRVQARPMQHRCMYGGLPRKQGFLHMAGGRARDSGNKIEASAHGMRSGGLAVDAMAIGCLGVERRVERFFSYLAIFRPGQNSESVEAEEDTS